MTRMASFLREESINCGNNGGENRCCERMIDMKQNDSLPKLRNFWRGERLEVKVSLG